MPDAAMATATGSLLGGNNDKPLVSSSPCVIKRSRIRRIYRFKA
jgi:hypothetical protein